MVGELDEKHGKRTKQSHSVYRPSFKLTHLSKPSFWRYAEPSKHVSNYICIEKKADTLTSASPASSQSLHPLPLHQWISTAKEFSTTFPNFNPRKQIKKRKEIFTNFYNVCLFIIYYYLKGGICFYAVMYHLKYSKHMKSALLVWLRQLILWLQS